MGAIGRIFVGDDLRGVCNGDGLRFHGFRLCRLDSGGHAAVYLGREFVRRVAFAHLQMATVLGLDVAASAMQLAGLIALRWLDL